MVTYTEIGPASTDLNAPTVIRPGEISTTTYDTSTGQLHFSLTATEECTVRIDAMTSHINGSYTGESPHAEFTSYGDFSTLLATTDSPSLRGGVDDLAFYMKPGEVVPLVLTCSLGTSTGGGAWTGPLLYEQVYSQSYPTYEAFEADVIVYYGTMDAFIAVYTDTYGPPGAGVVTHGVMTAVVRVSPATTWTDDSAGTWHVSSDQVETFDTVPPGDVVDGSLLGVDTFSSYYSQVGTERAHSGTQSFRTKTGSSQVVFIKGGGVSYAIETSRFRPRRTFSYWAYYRHGYTQTPYWGTSQIGGGLHSSGEPGALDIAFRLNNNNGVDGTPETNYASDTMLVSVQRAETGAGAIEHLDTGVNVWDGWFRYSISVDYFNDTMRLAIDQGGPELWSYEWSTKGFLYDGRDLTSVNMQIELAKIYGTSAQLAAMTPQDHLDWYDDVAILAEEWRPYAPPPGELSPQVAPVILADQRGRRRIFAAR